MKSNMSDWEIWKPTAIGSSVFVLIAIIGWLTSPADIIPNDDWRVLLLLFVGIPIVILGFCIFAIRLRRANALYRQSQQTMLSLKNEYWFFKNATCYSNAGRFGFLTQYFGTAGALTITKTEMTFDVAPGGFHLGGFQIPMDRKVSISANPFRKGFYTHGLQIELDDGTIKKIISMQAPTFSNHH